MGHDDDVASVQHGLFLIESPELHAETLIGGVCEECPAIAQAALDRILSRYDALVAAWKAQDANYNAADAVLSGRINYEEREAYNYDAWAAHDNAERLMGGKE